MAQYFQVGMVAGGISKCGDKNIPSYFIRLDNPEIAHFIATPDNNDIAIPQPTSNYYIILQFEA